MNFPGQLILHGKNSLTGFAVSVPMCAREQTAGTWPWASWWPSSLSWEPAWLSASRGKRSRGCSSPAKRTRWRSSGAFFRRNHPPITFKGDWEHFFPSQIPDLSVLMRTERPPRQASLQPRARRLRLDQPRPHLTAPKSSRSNPWRSTSYGGFRHIVWTRSARRCAKLTLIGIGMLFSPHLILIQLGRGGGRVGAA